MDRNISSLYINIFKNNCKVYEFVNEKNLYIIRVELRGWYKPCFLWK